MKTRLLLCILCLVSTSLSAQVSFSCTHKEFCDEDPSSGQFTNCVRFEESSLFTWNENETLIKHTSETMSSTYYVQERDYDEAYDVYTYNVISDIGDKYYFVVDAKNKQIRALSTKNDETKMIRWYVKAIF